MSLRIDEASQDARNFASLVKARVSRRDNVFIRSDDGRLLSHEDFWGLAGCLASALREKGVKPGDRVVVQAEKSVEALALFLGCARLGAVFVPLNTAYTDVELEFFLEDAAPSVVICSPDRKAVVSHLAAKHRCGTVLTLDENGNGSFAEKIRDLSLHFADSQSNWNDLAAILYTSGTTGRSKGAMLTQANLASNAITLADVWRFTPDDVLIHALPIHHTHGLFTAVNTILLSGGSLQFRRKFDAGEVISLFPGSTAMMGVPTYYSRLLQHPGLTREATRVMRVFISGSAPLSVETHLRFQERTGHAILERYGMTETSMNTSIPYDGPRIAGTVGLPLPGISLRITDPATGESLASGEAGMIEVQGPNVFAGYWRKPEARETEFRRDGYFITGDLGRVDQNGYLTIVGRSKDLIISGGLNIYPKEVEIEIEALEGISECAVIGVPHADFGEAVIAIVVMKEEASRTADAVIGELEGRLAKFKLPKRVIAVNSLPRNAMGKIQKNVLRDTYKHICMGN